MGGRDTHVGSSAPGTGAELAVGTVLCPWLSCLHGVRPFSRLGRRLGSAQPGSSRDPPVHRDKGQPSLHSVSPHCSRMFRPSTRPSLSFEASPSIPRPVSHFRWKTLFLHGFSQCTRWPVCGPGLTHLTAFLPGKLLGLTSSPLQHSLAFPGRQAQCSFPRKQSQASLHVAQEPPVLLFSFHVCETELGVTGQALNWESAHLRARPGFVEVLGKPPSSQFLLQ